MDQYKDIFLSDVSRRMMLIKMEDTLPSLDIYKKM